MAATRDLVLEDIDRIPVGKPIREALGRLVAGQNGGRAWITEESGSPVFACGVSQIFQGHSAEAWILVIDEEKPITIVRHAKKVMKEIAELGYPLLQATVRADDETTIKLDTHLGFELECRRKGFYPDGVDALILRYNYGNS